MKNLPTFEQFINESNEINELRTKTKADIKKIFGKAVRDIDPDEDGGSHIVQGDLEKIKSIAKEKDLAWEEVEAWGIRIWENNEAKEEVTK